MGYKLSGSCSSTSVKMSGEGELVWVLFALVHSSLNFLPQSYSVCEPVISYSSTSKRLSTTEAQLGTIRMTVQGGLLSVYHTYGTKKWAAIQEMSEELVQRAHTAGFPHIAENMRISTEGMEAYEERFTLYGNKLLTSGVEEQVDILRPATQNELSVQPEAAKFLIIITKNGSLMPSVFFGSAGHVM
ncbi:hypothetical protein MAR_025975 [Mya arenaria]|uniref:Uncharacterized protein n=1 Tax=Mya arenaria TaxID=6604 RepID=A0ABY7EP75_MYAAR|nr:hypothetical protein MAR_025975 [Mya arenaria]